MSFFISIYALLILRYLSDQLLGQGIDYPSLAVPFSSGNEGRTKEEAECFWLFGETIFSLPYENRSEPNENYALERFCRPYISPYW